MRIDYSPKTSALAFTKSKLPLELLDRSVLRSNIHVKCCFISFN